MILHHLNHSRSFRILWLLEELELDYELVLYERVPPIMLAPKSLFEVNNMGKSPYIEDGDVKMFESSAIVEYIINVHGGGCLGHGPDSPQYSNYLELLHYAEGSAMTLPIAMLLNSIVGGRPRYFMKQLCQEGVIKTIEFLSNKLGDDDYFVGNEFSAVDIMFEFNFQALSNRFGDQFPENLSSFQNRMQQRDAYQRAIEKGNGYDLSVFSDKYSTSLIKNIIAAVKYQNKIKQGS